jgi:hypothetical protein
MRDTSKAPVAAHQLREGAADLSAALLTLAAGGAPIPVLQSIRASVASIENAAHMLEEIAP